MNIQTQYRHKRKKRYIDPAIQNRLLISFILLEALLIGIGMIVLYLDMKEVADENLYRIHFSDGESLSALLLREAIQALVVLVTVNMAALGLAQWWWSRYLNSILQPFSDLLSRTRELDFTHDPAYGQQHTVLEYVLAWREIERARCNGIHAEISRLSTDADYASESALENTREALKNLKACLPVYLNRPWIRPGRESL